jgi:hypothetical protein
VAPAAQVSKWGFAPGCDDTLQLQLGDTQALEGMLSPLSGQGQAGPNSTGQGSGLTAHLQGLHISEVGGGTT